MKELPDKGGASGDLSNLLKYLQQVRQTAQGDGSGQVGGIGHVQERGVDPVIGSPNTQKYVVPKAHTPDDPSQEPGRSGAENPKVKDDSHEVFVLGEANTLVPAREGGEPSETMDDWVDPEGEPGREAKEGTRESAVTSVKVDPEAARDAAIGFAEMGDAIMAATDEIFDMKPHEDLLTTDNIEVKYINGVLVRRHTPSRYSLSMLKSGGQHLEKIWCLQQVDQSNSPMFKDFPYKLSVSKHTDLQTLDAAQEYLKARGGISTRFDTTYYFNHLGEYVKQSEMPAELAWDIPGIQFMLGEEMQKRVFSSPEPDEFEVVGLVLQRFADAMGVPPPDERIG